jgi:hypothetical protein
MQHRFPFCQPTVKKPRPDAAALKDGAYDGTSSAV